MRIIAGEFRGRKLLAPRGDVTRPITDRVKQSLFDILTPNLPDAVVLDLFAGTGSMGLECLSRGARHASFFEADRSALIRLRQNLQTLGLDASRAQISPGDIFKWFKQPSPQGNITQARPPATLAFLDPPYRFLNEQPADLRMLAESLAAKISTGGIIVFRHDAKDQLELPRLERYDQRTYGDMTLEFLTPP